MKVEAGRKIFGDTNRLPRTQELGCSPCSVFVNSSTVGQKTGGSGQTGSTQTSTSGVQGHERSAEQGQGQREPGRGKLTAWFRVQPIAHTQPTGGGGHQGSDPHAYAGLDSSRRPYQSSPIGSLLSTVDEDKQPGIHVAQHCGSIQGMEGEARGGNNDTSLRVTLFRCLLVELKNRATQMVENPELRAKLVTAGWLQVKDGQEPSLRPSASARSSSLQPPSLAAVPRPPQKLQPPSATAAPASLQCPKPQVLTVASITGFR